MPEITRFNKPHTGRTRIVTPKSNTFRKRRKIRIFQDNLTEDNKYVDDSEFPIEDNISIDSSTINIDERNVVCSKDPYLKKQVVNNIVSPPKLVRYKKNSLIKNVSKYDDKRNKNILSNNISNGKSDLEVNDFLDAFKDTIVSKKTYEVDAKVFESVQKEMFNKKKEENICDNDGNMMIVNNSKPDRGSNIYSQNFQSWLQEQSK